MKRRNFLQTGAAAAAASLMSPALLRAQAAPVITFGGSIPMSGAAAETGTNVLFGYRTAVKKINEDLGGVSIGGTTYQLALNLFDDASDPSRATTLIQRQVDEGVDFYLGSFGSNIVLPTCAITEAAGRIMVQAGGGSDLIFTQGRERVFGIFPRATRQWVSTRNALTKLDPAVKRVSLMYTNDAFSETQANGAKATLEEAGIQIVDFIALPLHVSDVTNVLSTIRASAPDALICTTHDETSILIARQMVATDTNVPLLYQTLGPQTHAYHEALGNYANGVVTQSYWSERAAAKCDYFGGAQQFYDYYHANFDRPFAYHMASGAVCILAYLQAAKNAGTLEVDAVRDALSAMDHEFFYGRVKFTPEGDGDAALLGPLLIQRQAGEMEVVAPETIASKPMLYPAPAWKDRA